jgi:hypothetical protein
MQVTRAEMLLYHENPEQMKKMFEWLKTHDDKFLFDGNQRLEYGLPIMPADWARVNVLIDGCEWNLGSPVIDLRFTLKTYTYPHALAHILRTGGWKIKGRYQEISVDMDTEWKKMHFSGPWTELCDPGFPALHSAAADRARQEGGRAKIDRSLAELKKLAFEV